ncbi:hypothetical protein [Cryptosporangium arvum]|uniref:hypothetical protein n=1 Tax=Cryptosporangium arvum TaxID=80871 RepID=UPI0004B46D80|nr:hypothetical protein [Cryptosporangium arvum]
MTPILRGAAAALAALAVTAGLAVTALALLDLPMTLVPAVLSAAAGAPAELSGEVATPLVPIALRGTVDVVPLGITAPGVVVLALVSWGSARTPLRTLALRAAGTAGTAVVALAVLSRAGSTVVDVPLPAGRVPLPTSAALMVEPGSAVLSGLLAVLGLAAAGALLTRVPYRRVVMVTVLAGAVVPVLIGLVAAVVLVGRQPALAGAALLFGANAVLAAVGASSLTGPGGPSAQLVDAAVSRADWLPGAWAPATAVFVLLATAALALTAPRPHATPPLRARRPGPHPRPFPATPRTTADGRWRRAGTEAVVAGAALGLILALTALLTAGGLDLAISLAVFRTPLLALRLEPAPGWALLAGALAGALAGGVGSLTADVRWRAQQRLLRRIRAYG